MAKIYGQLEKAQLEMLASDPSSPVEGMIYYNTTNKTIKLYQGSSWLTIADLSSSQTLTNKTITGSVAANLVNGAATITLPSATGTIATLAGTEALTNKDIDGGTASNTARITVPKGTFSLLNSLIRKEGTLCYATDQKKIYFDNGVSLSEVGSGSGGGINYIKDSSAETGTMAWATYDDGSSATSPVDGTDGSPQTVLWTTSSATPLRGSLEFLLNKTGSASRKGQGASYDFTIDNADKAKVLTITFDYAIRGTTYADGDVTVWIYDKDAGVLIQPAGYQLLNAATGLPQKFIATFQTSASSTNYRLIFHIATTSTQNYSIGFESISVGPQTVQYGAPITDWQDYSCTLTGITKGDGTVVSKYRRVGDSAEVLIKFTAGSTSATTNTWQFSLPFSADSDFFNNFTSTNHTIGVASWLDNTVGRYVGYVRFYTGSSVQIGALQSGSTSYNDAGSGGSPALTSGDIISLFLTYKVAGWSSTVQMSNDTDTRVLAEYFKATSSQTLEAAGAGEIVIYNSLDSSTHSAYNSTTGIFTAPVSGKYRINASIGITSAQWTAGNLADFYVRKNTNQQYKQLSYYICEATNTRVLVLNGSAEFNLDAGDTLDVFFDHNRSGGDVTLNGSGQNNHLEIVRETGPSAIAATEVVALEANTSTTTISATSAPGTNIIFTSKPTDTHNCMSLSTGVITIPTSGYYVFIFRISVNAVTASSIGDNVNIQLNVNSGTYRIIGSSQRLEQTTTAVILSPNAIVGLNLNAGDTVELEAYKSSTLVATATLSGSANNYLSMFRVK
jgi:hypothetical protein